MLGSRLDLRRTAFARGPDYVFALLGLGKDAPLRRAVQRSGAIVTAPVLSGLHHRYARIQFSGDRYCRYLDAMRRRARGAVRVRVWNARHGWLARSFPAPTG